MPEKQTQEENYTQNKRRAQFKLSWFGDIKYRGMEKKTCIGTCYERISVNIETGKISINVVTNNRRRRISPFKIHSKLNINGQNKFEKKTVKINLKIF